MEMEMEANDEMSVLTGRLAAAAEALEQAAQRLAGIEIEATHTRESELETRLAEAEATIATLKASGRKTAAAGTMVAKEGVTLEAAGLDAALTGLSVEQRIAVKAGLLRNGFLG